MAQYKGVVDVFKPLRFPLLKVIGNHDCALNLPADNPYHHKDLYGSFFGPLNYSFDYGEVHFVALDADIEAGVQAGKWRDGAYDVIDERALAWIEKDLSFQPKGKPIVLFTHQPPYEQKNFDRLLRILRNCNFKGAFAGHWHRNNTLAERTREAVGTFVVTGSLYGGWSGKPNADGTWRGYRVVSVDGDKVNSCYAAIDKPYQGALLNVNVKRTQSNPLRGVADIQTQVFDPGKKLKGVSVRIGGDPEAMKATPENDLWSLWSGAVDTTKLLDGPHKLIVAPFTEDGRWSYEFDVVVKNR
jgi:hypothetical protein